MSDRQPASPLWKVLSSASAAILLSIVYPTLFTFSQNWYTASGRDWALLFVFAILLALAVAGLFHVVARPAARLLARATGLEEAKATRLARAVLLAIACVVPFFLLFDGTFRDMLGGTWRVLALQVIALAAAAALFWAGHVAKYSALLAIASAASLLGLTQGYLSAAEPTPGKEIAAVQDFESAELKSKPNIYFFIYDAYGSKHAYADNFGFDNSKHYSELEDRGFRVMHTLSNYANTWGTTLSFFSGSHHYYAMNFGNDDTTSGRDVLNGNAHNPVIGTLRRNGYRVQFVHASDYFVSEQGDLDIAYPAKPFLSVLQLYGSERLDELVGLNDTVSRARLLEQQDAYLLGRIPEITGEGAGPWFTFFWKPLPSHSNKRVFFAKQAGFAEKFIERTQQANARMLPVIDGIIKADPDAIIVIIGDHGAWRYAGVTNTDANPNRAFKKHGIGAKTATLDFFGAMIAIRSAGRCDELVYPGITPVNVMRAVFACLSGRRDLLDGKVEDISMFRASNKLWLTGRDGNAAPAWKVLEAPK